MLKRYITILAGTCAAMANAYVNIDDFSSGTTNFSINSGSHLEMATGTMVGGDRYVRGDVDSNPLNRSYSFSSGGGYLFADSGSGLSATTSFGWGYKANPNNPLGVKADDLNLDLTGNDRLCVTTAFNDQNVAMRVFVLSDGVGLLSATHMVPGSGTNFVTNDFLFSEYQGINWKSVDQIVVHIYGTAGSDVAIDNVFAAKVAPEPLSMLALGVGLAGLVRKRKNS